MARELPVDVAAEVRRFLVRRSHPGDEQARRDRYDQRGNLRDEAVADGEDGVAVQRVAERHAALRDAHRETADDIDERHDEARDRIALDELHGAVERAVEIGLAFEFGAQPARVRRRDHAAPDVGVDAHLAAGNAVEREARGHFRDAVRALRHDDELDCRQHDEHHEPHRHVAAHDHFAEGADDRAGMRVQQDHLGRRDGERETQERGEQEQRRKARQLDRLRDIERRAEHEQARAEAHANEEVEDEGRDRHDEQCKHAQYSDADGEVRVTRKKSRQIVPAQYRTIQHVIGSTPGAALAAGFHMAVAFVVAMLALDFLLVHAKPAQPEEALDEIVGA